MTTLRVHISPAGLEHIRAMAERSAAALDGMSPGMRAGLTYRTSVRTCQGCGRYAPEELMRPYRMLRLCDLCREAVDA